MSASKHERDVSDPLPTVSVVVPVYRSEPTLRELHRQLTEMMPGIASRYEIIFVEDCGGDGSWAVISDLAASDDHVRGFRMSRNYGQHNALLCAIRAAHYELIVTLDDDLQHPVSEIPRLLAALSPDIDVVYGTPQQEQHGLWRDFASRLTKFVLARAIGMDIAGSVSAFRVFRTRLRDGFRNYRSPTVSIDVLLTWATTRFGAIKVRHEPRRIGASGYTVGRLIRHAIDLLTGFSALPLQIASVIGFTLVLFGISILAYVLVNYMIRGSAVPGFAFIASIVVIFSGAQLFALGVIGEYLARMHFRTMDRPSYLVSESVGADVDSNGRIGAGRTEPDNV